ncbi:alkaline phosphatase family protein [Bdellovibrionota bacterium FG-1]
MKKTTSLFFFIPLLCALALPLICASGICAHLQHTPTPNVILLTLDGVRWEEVFQGVDPGQSLDSNPKVFDFLLGTLSQEGFLVGDRSRGEIVNVGNRAQNSLPGYQSIMGGATQPCETNACGRIKVETFPERIVQDLGLRTDQVATIASWEKIALAAEHVEGTTFVNAGNRPFQLPSGPDPEIEALNQQQAQDPTPWAYARFDKYTFAHALHFLKKERPRFLFIALNDSDEWGHKGKYEKYLATLRQQDSWVKELVTTLNGMGDYGAQTTLIITTDHGRGDGNDWNEHGSGYKDSKSVWIYGRSPYTRTVQARAGTHTHSRIPASKPAYSHLDIRPTIEAIFGLPPKMDGVSPPPGKVIQEITGILAPHL